MRRKENPSLKARFEGWFRNLTTGQMLVFLAGVVASGILVVANNPLMGYARKPEAVRASMDEALAEWKKVDAEKWQSYDWNWRIAGNETQGGYFYYKKNPWWWIFAYESRAYVEWDADQPYGAKSAIRLQSLGGLVSALVVIFVGARTLMWLVAIRAGERRGNT